MVEKDRPSLPKLLLLNLPEKVGVYYREFGTILLNDKDGSKVDVLEHDFKKSNRITLKILQEWVLGKGLLVTWKALIQTLRDCNLNALADQIQKKEVQL